MKYNLTLIQVKIWNRWFIFQISTLRKIQNFMIPNQKYVRVNQTKWFIVCSNKSNIIVHYTCQCFTIFITIGLWLNSEHRRALMRNSFQSYWNSATATLWKEDDARMLTRWYEPAWIAGVNKSSFAFILNSDGPW